MKRMKICDTHNDFLTELPVEKIAEYVKDCEKFNVEKICASFWSSRKKETEIKRDLEIRSKMLKEAGNSPLLHLEDLWWVKTKGDLCFLEKLRPFSCSLTWNGANSLAGGVGSQEDLSEWGKEVLQVLLKNNIVVDVAHLNRKSFWTISRLLKKPFYCSHTGFYGLKKHPRNLTDKQIEKIVDSGGFVGLFFFEDCIKNKKRLSFDVFDIATNIKYFTNHWGFENLGIGTDFYGIEKYPMGLESYDGFETLKNAMEREGFSKKQIEKIFYQNFENFIMRVQNF